MVDENDIQQFNERYRPPTTDLRNDLLRLVNVRSKYQVTITRQFQEPSRSDNVPDVELSVVRRGLLGAVFAFLWKKIAFLRKTIAFLWHQQRH